MPSKSDADKVLKRFDDKIFVFNCKEEIDLVYNLIIHSAGFDVDIGGLISIRRYEHPVWAIEWEEYYNPHDNGGTSEMEVLEFDDPHKAAECFVELRHKTKVGLDMNYTGKTGYYLLGSELEEFKAKYIKKV